MAIEARVRSETRGESTARPRRRPRGGGRPWRIFLALIWMMGGAQGGEAAQSGPAMGPAIGFTVFAAEPIEGLAYMTQPEGKLVALRFFPTARSLRHEVHGRQPLRLLDTRAGEVVAEVVIPDPLREVLLLVMPESPGTNSPHYRVTVIDDGPRQRTAGQIQIMNLSGLELSGELNGRRTELRNGLNPAVAAGRSARLVLRTVFRGRTYTSWHDTIPLGPTDRALVILFPPFLSGSLEVQTRVLLDAAPATPSTGPPAR